MLNTQLIRVELLYTIARIGQYAIDPYGST